MSGKPDVDSWGGCNCETCTERAKHLRRVHDAINEVKKELEQKDSGEPGVDAMTRDIPGVLQCMMDVLEGYVNVTDANRTDSAMAAAMALAKKVKRMADLSAMTNAFSNALARIFTGGMGIPVAVIRKMAGVDRIEEDDDGEDECGGGFNMPPFGAPPSGFH
jgi:hypothetical protein